MENPSQFYAMLVEKVGHDVNSLDVHDRSVIDSIEDYAGFCRWFQQNASNPSTFVVAKAILGGFFHRVERRNLRVSETVKTTPWRLRAQKKSGEVDPKLLRWLDAEDAKLLMLLLSREGKRQVSLESVTVLTNESAETLLQLPVLNLNGLSSLTLALAGVLGRHTGELILDGLQDLDDEVAERLCIKQAKRVGGLSLNGIDHLTAATAEKIIQRPSAYLSFSGLKQLHDPAIASILAKFRGELKLLSLSECSEAVAEGLSQYPGTLSLDGLTTLSAPVAKGLAKHRGDLWLESIDSLSAEAAQGLGQLKGTLGLSGITTLSADAAEGLSTLKGDLWLSGLESLDAASAKALGKIKGCLGLDGLIALSKGEAEGFCHHDGGLRLERLTSLDVEVAKCLSHSKGELWLDGIAELDYTVAQGLSYHRGGLSLDHLPCISASVARALATTRGFLRLDGMREMSDDVAEGLSTHEGSLSLKAVPHLNLACAEALSEVLGEINLADVRSIKPKVAKALANHRGELSMSRLRKINRPLLMALSQHKHGSVIVDGAKLSTVAFFYFLNYPCTNVVFSHEIEQKVLNLKKWF